MIGNVFLENFQGFAEGLEIPIRPLTLIFGPNSSGKSAIIRAIRFAQQSLSPQDRSLGNNFISQGTQIDIGSFQTAVNRHDSSKKMRIGLEVGNPVSNLVQVQKVVFTLGEQMQCEAIAFIGIVDSKEDSWPFRVNLRRTNLTFKSNQPLRVTASTTVYNRNSKTSELWKLDKKSAETVAAIDEVLLQEKIMESKAGRNKKRSSLYLDLNESEQDELRQQLRASRWTVEGLLPRRSWHGDVGQRDSSGSQLGNFLRGQLRTQFTDHIFSQTIDLLRITTSPRNMAYVGPLRTVPDRITFISGSKVSLAADGSDIASALAANPETRNRISEWLVEATNGTYELEFVPFEGEAKAIYGDAGALVLRDRVVGANVAFTDAGTGLSQILPILEKMVHFDATRSDLGDLEIDLRRGVIVSDIGSSLLIEQPELHLHPKMQSDLMGLFVKHVSESRGASQIIAETHSETMVLRLQREIQNSSLNPEMVSVIYVQKNKLTGDSEVISLPMNSSGNFLSTWPESFSDLRLAELGF